MTPHPADSSALAEALRRQRDAWQSGQSLTVEQLLDVFPGLAADPEAQLDLIYQECLLREESGQVVPRQEYAERFPHLAVPLRLQFEVEDALSSDPLLQPRVEQPLTLPETRGPEGEAPRVEGCTVLDELGRGAMGVVYRGWQQAARRPVAIKLLSADVPAARVRTEAQAAARLHHPHIVAVYDVKEAAGRTALLLEYVEGGTLAEKLAGRPQPARDAARLVEQLAVAMAYAHERGVIHRDLKPSNVLLAGGPHAPLAQCVPKIGDFGLAKLTEGGEKLTRTSDVLGTPSYMAPEQAGGATEAVGPAADVYALGAILYELLTGRAPFVGETLLATLDQVRRQEAMPPSRLRPGLPRDLEVICLKCLHKSPTRRYVTARDLADDLHRWQNGEPIQARPAGPVERTWMWGRRHPVPAALGGAAVAAAVFALAGGLWLSSTLRGQRDRARARAAQLDEQLSETRQTLYGAQLLRIGALWPTDPTRALRLLDDPAVCPPELRCFSWGVLHAQCRPYQQAAEAHAAPLSALAVDPRGEILATADTSGIVRLWDAATCRVRATLAGGAARVAVLAFAPDASLVAAGDDAGTVRLWDVSAGTPRGTIANVTAGRVAGLAWHPDGRTLAVSGGEPGKSGAITLWDARTRRLRRTLREGCHSISPVGISPDGTTLVAAGTDHAVRFWDPRTGRLRRSLPGHAGPVRCLQFTTSGNRLVSGSLDGVVRLWDPVREAPLQSLTAPAAIRALALHPAGQTLAVATDRPADEAGPAEVRLWDLVTLRPSDPLRGLPGAAGLAFTPDGTTLFTGGSDRWLRAWTYPPRREVIALRGHQAGQGTVALSADGRTLAWIGRPEGSSGAALQISTLDLTTHTALPMFRGHGRPLQCLCLSAEGRRLAAAAGHPGEPAELLVWEVRTGHLIQALSGPVGAVAAIELSADGTELLSASREGSIQLWDVATGRCRRQLAGPAALHTLAWHRETGQILAAGQTLLSWRGQADEPSLRFTAAGSVTALAVSPDGGTLVYADSAGVLHWTDLSGGTSSGETASEDGTVVHLAFHPDGRTLAVAGEETVRLWDVPTRQERAVLPGHRGGACYARFAADGRLLFTASRSQTARLWRRGS